jgi:hypothetical protein
VASIKIRRMAANLGEQLTAQKPSI